MQKSARYRYNWSHDDDDDVMDQHYARERDFNDRYAERRPASEADTDHDLSMPTGQGVRDSLVDHMLQSFDFLPSNTAPDSSYSAAYNPHFQADRKDSIGSPFVYHAAPTPLVPVGPRGEGTMTSATINPYSHPAEDLQDLQGFMPQLERKRSNRSNRSAMRPQYNSHDSHDSRDRELPPLPAVETSTPAPLNKTAPARPGIFRRFFLGSKSHCSPINNNAATESDPVISPSPVDISDRPSSNSNHIASQLKSRPETPAKEPQVIKKKPSAFFRRRKKSVAEPSTPIPARPAASVEEHSPLQQKKPFQPLPLRLLTDAGNEVGNALSPMGSLRLAMGPYLSSTPQCTQYKLSPFSPQDSVVEAEDMRSFSPDYTPDKNATIRSIGRTSLDGDAENHVLGREQGDRQNSSPKGQRENFTRMHDITERIENNPRETKGRIYLNTNPCEPSDERISNTDFLEQASVAPAQVATTKAVASNREPVSTILPSPEREAAAGFRGDPETDGMKTCRDEEWVVVTDKKENPHKHRRMYIQTSPSDEEVALQESLPPTEGAKFSGREASSSAKTTNSSAALPATAHAQNEKAAQSAIPTIGHVVEPAPEGRRPASLERSRSNISIDEPSMSLTESDREKVRRIFEGDGGIVSHAGALSWLTSTKTLASQRILPAFFELFDFANMGLLTSLRYLCSKLQMKGESQELDRLIVEFASRWCQCNPSHGFRDNDVVYFVLYSLCLLNSDLHTEAVERKQTKKEFLALAWDSIEDMVRPKSRRGTEPSMDGPQRPKPERKHSANSVIDEIGPETPRSSSDSDRPTWRMSMRPTKSRKSSDAPAPYAGTLLMDDGGPLVNEPFNGDHRAWRILIRKMLKQYYKSIQNEPLVMFGVAQQSKAAQSSKSTLAVVTNGLLRRTPSVLSKAPSEAMSYRSRVMDSGPATYGPASSKWTNRARARSRIYPNSTLGSSRTSVDDQSVWSKHSHGKTLTAMSMESLSPHGRDARINFQPFQQSIGFASALSQAIIREDNVSTGSELHEAPLLEDEALGLAGAPWAKEGMVKSRKHLDSQQHKLKDRGWEESFAVVDRGNMKLFSFSFKSKGSKSKTGQASSGGGVVGGGNWQDNAENTANLVLRHTTASPMPPPGYSKLRPHVFTLEFPNREVMFFEVGTAEILHEFVTTLNYWSARLTNPPLTGGISNIEYGWSDLIINSAMTAPVLEEDSSRPSTSNPSRLSMQSTRSRGSFSYSAEAMAAKARLPGDKVMIAEWKEPSLTLRASNLLEKDQLESLRAHVESIEAEFNTHNRLRSPMLPAFSTRHTNYKKAMSNWKRKSEFLLKEIVKYKVYIDALCEAQKLKEEFYKRKEMEIQSGGFASADE